MTELTQSEKRTIARIAAIDISRFKKWSLPLAFIFFGAAISEYVYACINHEYSINAMRVFLFLAGGGGFIDQARKYAVIQKLLQSSPLKDQIKVTENRSRQMLFYVLFALSILLFWLLNAYFQPKIRV